MPYTRRTFRRRTYRRRPTIRRRRPTRWATYSAAGSQLWKDVKYLKGLINVEFKSKDIVGSSTPDNSAGSVVLLNGLATGDDFNSRDGRQIRMKSIQLNMKFNLHASATATVVRVLLVLDTQPNAAVATLSGILDVGSAATVVAFRNLNNRKRFIILRDWVVKVNTNLPEITREYYHTLDAKTVYNATNGGTIADIETNSLSLWLASDEATNTPTVTYNSRVRFIDN